MNVIELGRTLKGMYDKAPRGHQVAHIHLFGIKYASIIIRQNYRVSDIIGASGLNPSYATEISKGIKLAEYVVPKE